MYGYYKFGDRLYLLWTQYLWYYCLMQNSPVLRLFEHWNIGQKWVKVCAKCANKIKEIF